ncbi:MAG TPA: flagellar basal body rod protein FlgC [Gemmatimonadaceae bacterium]|nr:flagellar basal body rod protein FlgC [Gemmatimonadaceae bacterium]
MPDTSIPGAPPLLPYVEAGATSAGMFRGLAISASGLSAQRVRLEVAANNIANAETTHGANGQPYRRQMVMLQPASGGGAVVIPQLLPLAGSADFAAVARRALAAPDANDDGAAGATPAGGVQVAAITEDPSEGPLVYDPGHPDANAQGYVRYPNVQITTEMVEMMDAKRVYEANATAFQAGKAMLQRAIEI